MFLPFLTDTKQAIQHLSLSKCFSPDEIPGFIIKSCSEIFAPLLSHIFNTSLLEGKFPTLCKQVAVVIYFQER
jgi:hypothetical protein